MPDPTSTPDAPALRADKTAEALVFDWLSGASEVMAKTTDIKKLREMIATALRAERDEAQPVAKPVAFRWRWTHEKWGPTSWLYQADRPRPMSTADGYQLECDALGVIPAPPAAAVEPREG